MDKSISGAPAGLPPATVLTILSLVDQEAWGVRSRVVSYIAKEAARLPPGEPVPLIRRKLVGRIGVSDGAIFEAVQGLEREQVLEVAHCIGRGGNLARLQENVARWRGVPWAIDPESALWEVAESLRHEEWRALERAIRSENGALYGAPLAAEVARSRARHYPPVGGSDEVEMARSRARKHVFEWRAVERAISRPNGAAESAPTTRQTDRSSFCLSTGAQAIRLALLRVPGVTFVASSQAERIEALIVAGVDPDWAIARIQEDARQGFAKVPALLNNLEGQAEALRQRLELDAERRAADREAAAAWREHLDGPAWRPPGGFRAALRPVEGHNGEVHEEEGA